MKKTYMNEGSYMLEDGRGRVTGGLFMTTEGEVRELLMKLHKEIAPGYRIAKWGSFLWGVDVDMGRNYSPEGKPERGRQ